ncbi:heme ABC transporter ATP-binding protein [Pseudoclavibacter chungangensis]|uniref:Heme ABC transporter ATP-binding protein n=2 Tax=Pseudoclavibacter chungangensis TaxID=587635 RepID=A0A7J5BRH6_9MICO|nr:heme ABC transporter ATP-binding protein [Pseudoclavibacter chungangensis]KAB1656902.1 heme ABC transporter ATP-binding protein [Pseudoclavibacter chungangensis]
MGRRRTPRQAAPGEVVLRVRGATVEFGERRVLDGLDLDIRAGEVLALVGPNGAGKSTLINVITNDVDIVEGTVELDGVPSHAWTGTELAMRRAVLLQQVDIAFPFTVEEVVDMGRSPWQGTSERDRDELITAGAMRRTDTERFADRHYPSLSGGERARAALARVLAQTASVMLLDEPTAAMDIRHQELVLDLVRSYAATGCAVVIIVHNLDLAAAYADRIALLDDGRIVADGTPEDVLTAELVSNVYEYPVQILRDPVTDAPIVVPVRRAPDRVRRDPPRHEPEVGTRSGAERPPGPGAPPVGDHTDLVPVGARGSGGGGTAPEPPPWPDPTADDDTVPAPDTDESSTADDERPNA